MRNLLRFIIPMSVLILSAPSLWAQETGCSLLLRPPFSEWSDQELIEQTQTNWKFLKSLEYKYTDLNVNGRIVIHGLPGVESFSKLTILSPEEVGNTVFRHYTQAEAVPQILQSKRFRAGKTSYVQSPYVYPDLTGIFLTLSKYSADDIGLDSNVHSAWVDVKLDPNTLVIRLEPGIYLVPGSTNVPQWLVESLKNNSSTVPTPTLRYDVMGWSAIELPISQIVDNTK